MRKTILTIWMVIAMGVQAQTAETTVTGYVTDTYCGRRGASEKHAEHARRTIDSGVAQYALYDEASKRLYVLEMGHPSTGSGQAAIEQYAGQRVKITGTLGTTLLLRGGQSYAPDAVAAYRDPSAPNGLRATGATGSNPATAGAVSGQAKVQSHEDALDQTTPIAGVLSISSVEPAPAPPPRRASTNPQ